MIWTDEKTEELRVLWASHSASECASILGDGCTRNAVVGKVHRLGLSGKVKPIAAPRAQSTRRCVRRDSAMRLIFVPKSEPMPAMPPEPVEPMNIRSALLTVQCQWITNDDLRAPLYCGHAVVGKTNWCAAHHGIVFTPASDARRQRPRIVGRAA